MSDIDVQSKQYAKQGLFIAVAMFLLSLVIIQVSNRSSILIPSVVSVLFSIIFDLTDSVVWRKIAKKDASYLPIFYTGVSGFRMLAALITMFVYYLIVGRAAMLEFFLVFMAYYVAVLIHHTIFFMRVSNHSCNTLKVDKI